MSSIFVFCLLLVTCHFSQAKTKTDISALLMYASQNSNCQKQGLQCKDCKSIQFCSGSLQSLFTIRCGDQNPSTPYCDTTTNSCTDAAPSACDIGDSSFICPGVGNYPDALDCTKYYTCNENKLAHKQECQVDTIYDHATQSCQEGATCLSYSSIDGLCSGIVNKYLPYKQSKNLYILCLAEHEPAILQCPKGETFSESDQSCKFECAANGFFSHAKDSTKFYSCIIVGSTIIQNKLECLYGTEFIETGDGKGICSIRTTSTSTTTTSTTTTSTTTDSIPELTTNIIEVVETTTKVDEKNESEMTKETNNHDTTEITIAEADNADVTESNEDLTTDNATQDRTSEKQLEISSEIPKEVTTAPQTSNSEDPTKESAETQISNKDDENQLANQPNIENSSIEIHSTESNENDDVEGSGNSAVSEEILEGNLEEKIDNDNNNEIQDELQVANVDENNSDIDNNNVLKQSEEISIIFHHETEYEEEILENYL